MDSLVLELLLHALDHSSTANMPRVWGPEPDGKEKKHLQWPSRRHLWTDSATQGWTEVSNSEEAVAWCWCWEGETPDRCESVGCSFHTQRLLWLWCLDYHRSTLASGSRKWWMCCHGKGSGDLVSLQDDDLCCPLAALAEALSLQTVTV